MFIPTVTPNFKEFDYANFNLPESHLIEPPICAPFRQLDIESSCASAMHVSADRLTANNLFLEGWLKPSKVTEQEQPQCHLRSYFKIAEVL